MPHRCASARNLTGSPGHALAQPANQADYAAPAVLDRAYLEAKLAAPHTWHAAEVFLYLQHRR